MSSIYDWALEASANANSDTIINWQEGQPPSSVNNSARAMMQRIAEFLSDVGGVKAEGTAANISATVKSPITKLKDGLVVKIIAMYNNVANTEFNLNNTGSIPIYKSDVSGISRLTGNEMHIGGIYELTFSQTLNSGTGGWFLMVSSPTQGIPTGMISPFATMSAPSGWLECNGRALSRNDYKGLFQVIGTKWGEGDKTTTFNIPDLRGEFLRGWDNGRSIDSGRVFASSQASQNLKHSHSATSSTAGNHKHTYQFHHNRSSHGSGEYYNMIVPDFLTTWDTSEAGAHSHTITVNENGGLEARPRNIAIMYAIKV